MGFRTARCSTCKANVKVPDTVTADSVKCKECGGTVKLRSATGDSPRSEKAELPALPELSVPESAAGAATNPVPQSSPPARSTPKSAGAKLRADRAAAALRPDGKKKIKPEVIVLGIVLFLGFDGFVYVIYLNNKAPTVIEAANTPPQQASTDPSKPADPAKPGATKPADPSQAPVPAGAPSGDFTPVKGTSPARWTELQKLVADLTDPAGGASAADAELELELSPNDSPPAILNRLTKLKLEDDTDYRMADKARKLLERIAPNNTIAWKSKDEADWLKSDQQAVKDWCELWTKASKDRALWKKLTGDESTPPNPPGGAPGTTPPVKKTDGR